MNNLATQCVGINALKPNLGNFGISDAANCVTDGGSSTGVAHRKPTTRTAQRKYCDTEQE